MATLSKAAAKAEDRSLVEPQLRDLMAMSRLAALLPSWSRSIRARHAGVYLASIKGRGMEYDESRPYQPGDDIRSLDWRVTARTGKPHTKLFREERERPVFICADLGRTMRFATTGVFKTVQAARIAALLAWKGQQSGDRTGGIVFSHAAHHELPPERGKPAVIRLLKLLAAIGKLTNGEPSPREGGGSFATALSRLGRIAKPGSLVFVISDFRELGEHQAADIVHLGRHNDVMLVMVFDPFETALPRIAGRCRISNGDADVAITLGDTGSAQRYHDQFAARQETLRTLCKDHGLLLAQIATDQDPLAPIQRGLSF